MSSRQVNFESKKAQKFFRKLTKNVDKVTDRQKDYVETISVFVFQDVMSHFEQERGSENKRWPEWSEAYTRHMIKKGKGSNFILQDTGRLRNNFKASNWKKVNRGLMWFNDAKTKSGFPYAAAHDQGLPNEQGNKLPVRRFMWLSNKAMKNINEATMQFTMRGL